MTAFLARRRSDRVYLGVPRERGWCAKGRNNEVTDASVLSSLVPFRTEAAVRRSFYGIRPSRFKEEGHKFWDRPKKELAPLLKEGFDEFYEIVPVEITVELKLAG